MVNSREMARIACKALEEKKGEDICVIDISNVSVLADYFIIANGTNSNQVNALVDSVEEELHKVGCKQDSVKVMAPEIGYCLITQTLSFMYLIKKIVYSMIWNVSGKTDSGLN